MEKFYVRYSILQLENQRFVIADKLQNDFIIAFKSQLKATIFINKINNEFVDESYIRRYVNDILKTR